MLQWREVIRKPLSVEEKIAITLWRLRVSTVCVTVQEVCNAIVNNLFQRYIKIPTGQSAETVVEGFLHQWGFPQCFGAIDA